jgi:hypothetical protein
MPVKDGLGLHHKKRVAPSTSIMREKNQDRPVRLGEFWTSRGAYGDEELLA